MKKTFSLVAAAVCMLGLSMAARAEQIDNPSYTNWSKFKAGTTVTHKMQNETKMAGMPEPMKTDGTMTTKLLEVKPTELTLEVTMKMNMNGQVMDQPPTKQVIPAKVEKGKDIPAPEGAEVKDIKEGTEKVEVSGKSYDTKTRSFTMVMKAPMEMTSNSKTWTSTDVPGGMVKTESKGSGSVETTMTMTLTEVKIEK